jgi:ribose transport system ATP-binding protein
MLVGLKKFSPTIPLQQNIFQEVEIIMAEEKLLELKGVVKRFGATLALDNVDFDLRPGEVHGLVGENGAGKSTLMKILSGYHREFDGEITIHGNPVHFSSTKDALTKGIGMIYQELSVIKTLTVAENIFLGNPPMTKAGLVDWKFMNKTADEHLKQLGLDVNVRSELSQYTVATRQMIEVARVIFSGADVIIMDEPTSALSHNEIVKLFDFIRTLKTQKKGVVFISHFLDDVLAISDRITVLRNGQKVKTVNAKDTNKIELTQAILGKTESVEMQRREVRPVIKKEEVVLEVKDLHRSSSLHGINFSVMKGEILGIFGGMGAGKTEIAQCLFGLDKPDSGSIILEGKEVHFKTSSEAKKNGVSYIPANRQNSIFPGNEIYKNITIGHLAKLCPGLVRKSDEMAMAKKQTTSLGVRPNDPSRIITSLSGGNQQKVVLGKWLTIKPKVLLLNDPTRGMDVGAKLEVMEIVEHLREEGVATILFSTEPELLMAYSDRVIVLRRGYQLTELPIEKVTKDVLLSYT